MDAEIISALRRIVLSKALTNTRALTALEGWRRLEIERHAISPLTDKVWALRDTFSAYDAIYVALAATLDAPLLTADLRLARSASVHCHIISVDN